MFQLTNQELENWRSQIVMSNLGARMGLRRPPYAFSEHGALMVATVLNSPRALMTPPEPKKRPIGFITPEEK